MNSIHTNASVRAKSPTQILRDMSKRLRKEIYKNAFELSEKFSEKPSLEARLEEEIAYTKELLKALEEGIAACGNRKIQELYKEMEDLLEDEKIRDIRSQDDQDARFGHKTPTSTFYGYKNHLSVTEERLTAGISVTHGGAPDGQELPGLIEKTQGNGVEVTEVIEDMEYASEDDLEACGERTSLIARTNTAAAAAANGKLEEGFISAFFYSWYMTAPIKKVSKLSKQMADMDFSGFCSAGRTDEIGVLSDSLNTLSRKLEVALSELQEANQKLQADIDMERRLEKQRVEFFAAASHELKTPITIIKGQLQGMLYQVGRYKDRETYLAQSLEIMDTLGKMVQELLTISRLDTPGYTCKKSNLNLGNLIVDRVTAFEDLFMQKDLTASQSISPEVYILGDMQLLQKALDNLLGNAAAYSGAGNQVLIKLWKDTETTTLTIENTGAHIPDEAIPKLFEPFYRVDQSRNRQTGGTGLGLYIVKTILNLHGAKIEIANTSQGVIVSVQF